MQMEAEVILNELAFAHAIACYLKLGWKNHALKLLGRYESASLVNKGPEPYNKLLDRLVTSQQDRTPENVFRRMIDNGIAPNLATFQALAEIYSKQGYAELSTTC